MQKSNVFIMIFTFFILFVFCGCNTEKGDFPSENNYSKFEIGTTVSKIDISGMTEMEALTLLKQKEANIISSYCCNLIFNGESFKIDSNDITLKSNLYEVISEAKDIAADYEIEVLPLDNRELDLKLAEIAKKINKDYVPKQIELIEDSNSNEHFTITDDIPGCEMDIEAVKEKMLMGMCEINIPICEVNANSPDPEMPVLRSESITTFNRYNENRVHNLELAASKLNGTKLLRGESFSFDKLLGPRTEENGWLKAEAFINGGLDSEEQYGGGICQVSTNLYIAALKAGLEVPMRCNHSKPVAYVPGGLDAAISEGGMDLIIKNTSDDTIYIFSRLESDNLICEIYGDKFHEEYDKIELESKFAGSIQPGADEFYDDFELSFGEMLLVSPPVVGSKYETYLVYYSGEKEIKRKKLNETQYKSHPAIYAVGKG